MLSHAPELFEPGVTATKTNTVSQKNIPEYATAWAKTRTFLQQDNPGKSIIQIPEVDAAHPALIVQLAIYIKGLIGRNLQFSHSLTRNGAILQGRIEFIAPRRSVTVPVSVVVTEQVVTIGFRASADLERLVYGSKQVFSQVRNEGRNRLQVAFGVARREAAKEITEDGCCGQSQLASGVLIWGPSATNTA
jgi:hypothetical protein